MSFGEAVGSVIRNYATFTGRARRAEYWWFVLASILIVLPFAVVLFVAFIPAAEDLIDLLEDQKAISLQEFFDNVDWEVLTGPMTLLGAVFLLLLLPSLAVTARRLHDIGISGWWMLVSLIPAGIGSAALLIMCVIDSQDKDNKWGPDPKADERARWGRVPEAPPPLNG